jgi:cyclophilin family peptidyl-prolyl cis-trans isomerase
MGSIGR